MVSILLLILYICGLVFAFRSNKDPLREDPGHVTGPELTTGAAIGLLTIATAITAVEAEVLVEALEPALLSLGMTELFAGVIVVALVGNAAEHYSAITAARDNQMTLALEISIGSSAQIALMVAPVLVLLSYAFGTPMSLVFNAFEIAAIGLSVLAIALVSLDGESNWLEGLQLLGLYGILAIAFYMFRRARIQGSRGGQPGINAALRVVPTAFTPADSSCARGVCGGSAGGVRQSTRSRVSAALGA